MSEIEERRQKELIEGNASLLKNLNKFKQDNKGAINFERVQVIKGTSDVGYTEVSSVKTIPPNAFIITKGAFFILAKMTYTGAHEH